MIISGVKTELNHLLFLF